jgi:hypothetical protein
MKANVKLFKKQRKFSEEFNSDLVHKFEKGMNLLVSESSGFIYL